MHMLHRKCGFDAEMFASSVSAEARMLRLDTLHAYLASKSLFIAFSEVAEAGKAMLYTLLHARSF